MRREKPIPTIMINSNNKAFYGKSYTQNMIVPANPTYTNPLTHIEIWDNHDDRLQFLFMNGDTTYTGSDQLSRQKNLWKSNELPAYLRMRRVEMLILKKVY